MERSMMNTARMPNARRVRATGLSLALLITAAPIIAAQTPADIQPAPNAAYPKYKDLQEGKNADCIPARAKVDPNLYGIALITAAGRVYTAGDTTTEVSIQSIS